MARSARIQFENRRLDHSASITFYARCAGSPLHNGPLLRRPIIETDFQRLR